MLGGNGFDGVLEGQHVIGSAQGIIILEVDLVLAEGNFVMTHLDFRPMLKRASISSVRTRTASSLAEKSK